MLFQFKFPKYTKKPQILLEIYIYDRFLTILNLSQKYKDNLTNPIQWYINNPWKLMMPANTEIILHISVKHYVKTVKYYSRSYKTWLEINFLR